MNFDAEMALLLSLLAGDEDGSDIIKHFETVDEDRFERLVAFHRITPLVHHVLSRLSEDVRLTSVWAGQETRNAMRQLMTAKAAQELTREFDQAGVVFTSVKGAAVADHAYERPSLRQSIDLDVIVQQDKFLIADNIVRKAGFVCQYPDFEMSPRQWEGFQVVDKAATYRRASDGVQLDLHWRGFRNPHLWPQFERDWPQWILRPLDGPWASVPRLNESATLAHTLVHGAHAGWFRLKWLVDLVRLTKTSAPNVREGAQALLQEAGLIDMGLAARDLCETCFGDGALPVWEERARTTRSNRLLRMHLRELFALESSCDDEEGRGWSIADTVRLRHALRAGAKYQVFQTLISASRPHLLEQYPLGKRSVILLPALSVLDAIKNRSTHG